VHAVTRTTRHTYSAQFISMCRWLQLIYKGWLAPLENDFRVAQHFRQE